MELYIFKDVKQNLGVKNSLIQSTLNKNSKDIFKMNCIHSLEIVSVLV